MSQEHVAILGVLGLGLFYILVASPLRSRA